MSIIFGERLRELRNAKNITQTELADILLVSKYAISAWELNKQEPSIDTLVKLSKVFDTSVDYLTGAVNEFGDKVSADTENEEDILRMKIDVNQFYQPKDEKVDVENFKNKIPHTNLKNQNNSSQLTLSEERERKKPNK